MPYARDLPPPSRQRAFGRLNIAMRIMNGMQMECLFFRVWGSRVGVCPPQDKVHLVYSPFIFWYERCFDYNQGDSQLEIHRTLICVSLFA